MRARWPTVVALALALTALTLWRVWCVSSGPDVDTDAYAHHMIARAILADPHDLAVHWVWLPLFHYLQVPLIAVGGTMQDVRWANVALSAATPLLLFAYVLRTARSGESRIAPEAVALVAALFAAACPIAMQMGTTAQPEPLFALLVLGVAMAFERRRYVTAAVLLGAATMLRYEAWASLATIAALLVVEPWWRRRRGSAAPRASKGPAADAREPWRAWLVVAVPVALILSWAAVRRPVDGQWFGFLRQTHAFAEDALHQRSAFDRGLLALGRDALYYPIYVPIRVLGPAMPLVPFGIVRTVRQQGSRFVLVLAACLGFVSLTWVMRAQLGLDRHFVCVVPLYATFAAQGMATIADGAARIGGRAIREPRRRARAGRAIGALLAVLSLAGVCVALDVWMGFWQSSIRRGWPDRVAVGAYLRALPGAPTIFCDDATVEILSGIDRRRFDRHWLDDPHTWDLVSDVARAHGVVYVATWRRKLHGDEREGDVVMIAGAVPGDDTSGIAVVRVTADAGAPPR